jgi:hypothetical protein
VLRRAQAARLLAVDRAPSGTRLLLLGRGEAVIGSTAGSGLRVADASVADRHAIIRYSRGRYYVRDLKSAGGTFLNGRRIRRTQALKHGDSLRFGSAVPYRFIDPDAHRRRRERRILRAAEVIAALVVVGLADHFSRLNLVSLDTIAGIAAWARPHIEAKRVDAMVAAPARPAAPVAGALPRPPAIHVADAASNLRSSSPAPWLARINFYRSGAGLAEISGNSEECAGVEAHARYLMLNFADEIRASRPLSPAAYEEDQSKSGYSDDGAVVAQNLRLAWGCSSYDAAAQIDRWIAGPFQRLTMLNPFLVDAAFGAASHDGCWVAALRLPPPSGEEVKPYPHAIEFPPDGANVSLDWVAIESPDPLASCPGYARPAGLPITLQLGRLVETKLSAHSLIEDGKPIEHCAFDAQSYMNQDPHAQEYGRWNLRSSSAVVIVPRAPLRPGSRYSVSIIANGATYAWSFMAAGTGATTFAALAKVPTAASP